MRLCTQKSVSVMSSLLLVHILLGTRTLILCFVSMRLVYRCGIIVSIGLTRLLIARYRIKTIQTTATNEVYK